MKIFTIDEQNAYMCNLIRAYESTDSKYSEVNIRVSERS